MVNQAKKVFDNNICHIQANGVRENLILAFEVLMEEIAQRDESIFELENQIINRHQKVKKFRDEFGYDLRTSVDR